MAKRKLLNIGDKFGDYTVVGVGPMKNSTLYWEVQCTCGNARMVRGADLRSGVSHRCKACAKTTHGEKRDGEMSAEYLCHRNMVRRCYDTRDKDFSYYGGRGVSVCDEWRGSTGFARFLNDVGRRPSAHHTIGRIDNNGNYAPGNVEWQTRATQSKNTRQNRYITVGDETLLAVEWSRRLGWNEKLVSQRMHAGWDPVVAATRLIKGKTK